MTHNIGGRASIAHHAAPVAVLPPFGAAQLGGCPCGQGTQTHPANAGTATQNWFPACNTVWNMRLEATVDYWSDDDNAMALECRVGAADTIAFTIVPSGAGPTWPNADYHLLSAGVDIAGSYNAAHPVPGDVLELLVMGSAVTAKVNGTTVLSGTDSQTRVNGSGFRIVTTSDTMASNTFEYVWANEDYCS